MFSYLHTVKPTQRQIRQSKHNHHSQGSGDQSHDDWLQTDQETHNDLSKGKYLKIGDSFSQLF